MRIWVFVGFFSYLQVIVLKKKYHEVGRVKSMLFHQVIRFPFVRIHKDQFTFSSSSSVTRIKSEMWSWFQIRVICQLKNPRRDFFSLI